jgi:Tfp pilus assembly protein PilO
MSTSLKHRSSWFITVPIAAGAIGFLSLIFFPTARTIRETRHEIQLKEDFIGSTARLPSTIGQLQTQLAEVQSFDREWEARMPSKAELATLFSQINALARANGAATKRFEPQLEKSMQLLARVPVKIELSGSYVDIRRVLAALEQMPQALWIDQVSLKRSHENGKDVEVDLKLEVFAGNFNKSG